MPSDEAHSSLGVSMLKFTLFFSLLVGVPACGKSLSPTPISPEVNEGYSEEAAAECMSIDVTKTDIRSVSSQSEIVRSEKWHNEHVYPTCHFTGSITYEGLDRVFRYYPTGYMYLEGSEGWFMCYDCSVNPKWVSFDQG